VPPKLDSKGARSYRRQYILLAKIKKSETKGTTLLGRLAQHAVLMGLGQLKKKRRVSSDRTVLRRWLTLQEMLLE